LKGNGIGVCHLGETCDLLDIWYDIISFCTFGSTSHLLAIPKGKCHMVATLFSFKFTYLCMSMCQNVSKNGKLGNSSQIIPADRMDCAAGGTCLGPMKMT
jgi:hypothetical protein